VSALFVVSPLILTFSPLRGEGTGCGRAFLFENFTIIIRFMGSMRKYFEKISPVEGKEKLVDMPRRVKKLLTE
jgi:hypothetical protein